MRTTSRPFSLLFLQLNFSFNRPFVRTAQQRSFNPLLSLGNERCAGFISRPSQNLNQRF